MILPRIFLTVISYFKKIQDLHDMQCVLLSALSNCQHIFVLFIFLVIFVFYFCFIFVFVFFKLTIFVFYFLKPL